jgi:hypothetical protein
MRVRSFLESGIRARIVCLLALGLIAAFTDTTALARTAAYFTASSTTPTSSMSTVRLDVSTSPSVSAVFNVTSNMLPGDFQIKTVDLVNNGAVGVARQDFTYSVTSSSTAGGNHCSLLDSSDPPTTCASPVSPGASATTGAALLLLRCTSDAATTIPLACDTQNVYLTQIYPIAGAGTQQQITSPGGFARSAISGVGTVASYSIGIAGTSFTGGQLIVGSPFGMGGPDSVPGIDAQTRGLAASRTDHLASVVYLPSQAGDTLADQTSILTFFWTASQRQGGVR